MALTHKEAVKRKKAHVDNIQDKMDRALIAIVTDYRGQEKGMTVKSISLLRRALRETDSECRVYKNTLCNIALKDKVAESFLSQFQNPTAIVFGYKDPAATSKALVDFLKNQKVNPLPVIKSAYMDGSVYSEKQVRTFATLPSRQELLSRLVGSMNSPIQGIVNVLSAIPRGLVTVIDQVRQKKEKGEFA